MNAFLYRYGWKLRLFCEVINTLAIITVIGALGYLVSRDHDKILAAERERVQVCAVGSFSEQLDEPKPDLDKFVNGIGFCLEYGDL